MADMTAGIGGVDEANARLAKATNALAAAMEEKARRVASANTQAMGGMSVAEGAHSDLALSSPFASPMSSRPYAVSQEMEANRIAKDFENDQAIQRDKAREKAEAEKAATEEVKGLSVALGLLAASVAVADRALSGMQGLQASGAEKTGNYRERLSSAMARLGYSQQEQEKAILAGETEGGLGIHMTRERQIALYESAVKGLHGAPPLMAQRDQINRIVENVGAGGAQYDQAREFLGASFLPQINEQIGTMGQTRRASTGQTADAVNAELRQIEDVAEADTYRRGTRVRRNRLSLQNAARRDPLGALSHAIGFEGLTVAGQENLYQRENVDADEAAKRHQENLAELRKMSNRPPSTDPTK